MRKTIAIAASALLLIGCAEMNTVLNDMNTIPTGPAPLTNIEVIKGLKEALSVGTNNSTALTSKLDGFYKNPEIFIPFPPEAIKVKEKVEKLEEVGDCHVEIVFDPPWDKSMMSEEAQLELGFM